MSRLTSILKNTKSTISNNKRIIENENIIPEIKIGLVNTNQSQFKQNDNKTVDNDGQNDLIFDLTADEIEKVRSSVVEIDTTNKDRRQIIIGMFGGIKNPKNGKRFVIPGVDSTTEDYVYEYAKYMRILVSKPEDFKKIMNWE